MKFLVLNLYLSCQTTLLYSSLLSSRQKGKIKKSKNNLTISSDKKNFLNLKNEETNLFRFLLEDNRAILVFFIVTHETSNRGLRDLFFQGRGNAIARGDLTWGS